MPKSIDRLLPLSRRAPLWLYVVAACFVGSFAVGVFTLWRGPEPPFRRYTFERDALRIEEMLPGSTMERAGLQAGDRVLSFGGLPTRGISDWDLLSISLEPNHPYTIDFERGGERHALTVTLGQRAFGRWPVIISAAFWVRWIVGVTFLVVAGFVVFNKPLDTSARFGALILGLDGLSGIVPITGLGPILRGLPPVVGPLLWWPVVSSAFLLPTLAFCFCATFPRPLFRDRRIWALALAPTALFVFTALPGFFAATFVRPNVYMRSFDPNLIPRIGGSILLGYVAAALVALVVNYRRLEVSEQRRLRVLVAGTVAGWGGPFLLGLLIQLGALTASAMNTLALVAAVLGFALPSAWSYAILRHRVFDISVILRQGLQYALARRVLLMVVPALGIVMLADLILHGQQPLLDILRARGWGYLGLGILAVAANVRRQQWLNSLDRRFFRERYDAQQLLKEVVELVREARSFPRVVSDVVQRLDGALHPQFVGLIARQPGETAYRTMAVAPAGNALPPLPPDGKLMAMMRVLGKPLELTESGSGWLTKQLPVEETVTLRRARLELIVPIALGADRAEAMLLLGAKRSEEPYTREDRDLLTVIAASLAILLDTPSASSVRSDVFEECPQCGACYDSGATQCSNEGKRLVPVYLPRLLEGRYLLQQRLGRGGMGTVYAASDVELERRVAVKVVREDFVGNADAAERFRREARAAAGFAHPNVVTVHDFGVTAGSRAFLVMELLEGQTLRALLDRDRLSAARTLSIMRPISAALAAAHRRQLVHRDLKPENVFLAAGETGEIVKVLDFGLAKFVSAATDDPTGQTAPGVVAGTPRYMSPEQRRGEQVQPAWDIWAAAVVAYELLAGAHPFVPTVAGDYARAIMGAVTPLGAYVAEAPPQWQAFFERALSPTIGLRPQSVDTFISALEMTLNLG